MTTALIFICFLNYLIGNSKDFDQTSKLAYLKQFVDMISNKSSPVVCLLLDVETLQRILKFQAALSSNFFHCFLQTCLQLLYCLFLSKRRKRAHNVARLFVSKKGWNKKINLQHIQGLCGNVLVISSYPYLFTANFSSQIFQH